MATRMDVPETVVCLERGTDEMLLVNSKLPNPIYINKGREYIKSFLKVINDIKIKDEILECFPEEKNLLNYLIDTNIVNETNFIEETNFRPANSTFKNNYLSNKPCDREKHYTIGMSLYLLLSHSCNLSCIYCLNGRNTYQKYKKIKMNEKVAFSAIEKCLKKLSPYSSLEIVFFGGEPLLNWTLAKNIILHCENVLRDLFPAKKWHFHLTTNLTLFPNDLIEWIKKYNISILCDIDGPPHLHNVTRPYINGKGSYADIVSNIKKLTNAGIEVSLRSTVTSRNVQYIPEIAEHHKKLCGNGSAFVPVNPVTSDEDILPVSMLPDPELYIKGVLEVFNSGIWKPEDIFPIHTFIERLKGNEQMFHGCGAPYGNTPVVDANGNVYACIYLVGISKYYIGNIFDNTYPKQEVIDYMLDILNIDNIENCKNCSWRYLCGGGCPVGKLTVLGNSKANKEIIDYTQQISCKVSQSCIEALLWNYAEKIPNKYS